MISLGGYDEASCGAGGPDVDLLHRFTLLGHEVLRETLDRFRDTATVLTRGPSAWLAKQSDYVREVIAPVAFLGSVLGFRAPYRA